MKINATKIVQLSMAISVLLMSGLAKEAEARSRKFSCPLPDKKSCMSTVDVYNATNTIALPELDMEQPKRRNRARPQPPVNLVETVAGNPVDVPPRCCEPTNTEVTIKGDTLAVASPVVSAQAAASVPANDLVVRTSRKEPFREPAQVMRIYIAPWEDESGDLHMGGYVFSEIVPRKWSVGTRQAESNEGFRLLTLSQTNGPNRDAAHDAQTSTGNATAQAGRTD